MTDCNHVDATMTAAELSTRFIDAYNRRDLQLMRAMLSPDVEYVRPGPTTFSSRPAVEAQYLRDWVLLGDGAHVTMRNLVQANDAVAAEIRLTFSVGQEQREIEGAVFHDWHNGTLVRYRSYFDASSERNSER